MRNCLSRFAAELGASAVEYALIASFMAVLIILPVTLVGTISPTCSIPSRRRSRELLPKPSPAPNRGYLF